MRSNPDRDRQQTRDATTNDTTPETVGGADDVASRAETDRLRWTERPGGATGGALAVDHVGDSPVPDDRSTTAAHWRRSDDRLVPRDIDVDGIDVTGVDAPANEALYVESSDDLVLSVSSGQGAIRIETEAGHEVVLDDAGNSRSLSVEDAAGNRVGMDPTTGEVSISANTKLTLDAPQIDVSAGNAVAVTSGNVATFESAGLVRINGALDTVNDGTRPAARLNAPVSNGVVAGSSTVLIG